MTVGGQRATRCAWYGCKLPDFSIWLSCCWGVCWGRLGPREEPLLDAWEGAYSSVRVMLEVWSAAWWVECDSCEGRLLLALDDVYGCWTGEVACRDGEHGRGRVW